MNAAGVVVSAEQRRRARNVGIAYLVLAAVTMLIFTRRAAALLR